MAGATRPAPERAPAAVLAQDDHAPRPPRWMGSPRHLLRLHRAVRRDRGARVQHRLHGTGVRLELLPRQLLPGLQGGAERPRDRADRRRAGDDGASRGDPPAQAELRPAGPRPRGPAVRPACVRGRRLGLRGDPAGHRAHRLRTRRRADRHGRPGVRGHPVRRLGRGAGALGRRSLRAGRLAPRAVVVPRAVGDRIRGQHPVHQSGAYAHEFRVAVAPGPAGGKAAAANCTRTGRAAGRIRRADGLQSIAPPAARRLHQVRQVPRGLPGQCHRPSALAPGRRPRIARAGKPGGGRRWDRRRPRRVAGRKRRWRWFLNHRGGSRRSAKRDGVVLHAVQRLRGDLPGGYRAGADHQPAAAAPRRGGRPRSEPPVGAPGHPQVGQLLRRESPPPWTLDAGAGLRGQGRPQGTGRPAVVRGRLCELRPALAAGEPRARSAAPRRRGRLRDPVRRRAQLGQRRAARGGGGSVRGAGRTEHRHPLRL